jgi:hypothetical protein
MALKLLTSCSWPNQIEQQCKRRFGDKTPEYSAAVKILTDARPTNAHIGFCEGLNAFADRHRAAAPINPWDGYFLLIKNNNLGNILGSKRCKSLAEKWEVPMPLYVAEAIHAACGISKGVDFLTYDKKSMSCEYVDLVINDVAVTDEAIRAEYDRIIAENIERLKAECAALAEVEAAAQTRAAAAAQIDELKAFNRDLNRRLESQNAKSLSLFQTERHAAARRLAEVEAAAQTRAAADAERIAAAEAAQAAAVARLAEEKAARAQDATAAAERIGLLEQQLSNAMQMAQNIFWAACEAVRGMAY